jgi:hypothetical protein
MFIIAQMNADGGEAVRFVVARIRTASLPSRIRYTFTIHGVLSARRQLVVENEVMSPDELLKPSGPWPPELGLITISFVAGYPTSRAQKKESWR